MGAAVGTGWTGEEGDRVEFKECVWYSRAERVKVGLPGQGGLYYHILLSIGPLAWVVVEAAVPVPNGGRRETGRQGREGRQGEEEGVLWLLERRTVGLACAGAGRCCAVGARACAYAKEGKGRGGEGRGEMHWPQPICECQQRAKTNTGWALIS